MHESINISFFKFGIQVYTKNGAYNDLLTDSNSCHKASQAGGVFYK